MSGPLRVQRAWKRHKRHQLVFANDWQRRYLKKLIPNFKTLERHQGDVNLRKEVSAFVKHQP